MSDRDQVDALIARAKSDFGGLDVLANVAGIPHDALVEELAEVDIDRVVGVNLKGTIFGCQAAIPLMAERGGGSIINVSSGAIDLPVANYSLYAMTKAAVAQLTQTLAQEVGDRGIRVNALAPGATVTNFTKRRLIQPDGSIDEAGFEHLSRLDAEPVADRAGRGAARSGLARALPGVRRVALLHRADLALERGLDDGSIARRRSACVDGAADVRG